MAENDQTIYVANESFVTIIDGERIVVQKGTTRVRAGHPLHEGGAPPVQGSRRPIRRRDRAQRAAGPAGACQEGRIAQRRRRRQPGRQAAAKKAASGNDK